MFIAISADLYESAQSVTSILASLHHRHYPP